MTTLTTERLSDSVGAEVVGLDVDRLMTDDALPEQILAALDANGVLVFRDLHLARRPRSPSVDGSAGWRRSPGTTRWRASTW